jgi:hypothetical protein
MQQTGRNGNIMDEEIVKQLLEFMGVKTSIKSDRMRMSKRLRINKIPKKYQLILYMALNHILNNIMSLSSRFYDNEEKILKEEMINEETGEIQSVTLSKKTNRRSD